MTQQNSINTSTVNFLAQANNLSDLQSATTARTNLGLGTASLQNNAFFLQSANNLSDLSAPATARTNLGLGTMATQNATAVNITGGSLSNSTLSTCTSTGQLITGYVESFIAANSGTAYALNPTSANNFVITLTGNCTFSFTGVPASNEASITLILKQDSTGSRAVTWPSSIIWPNATAPTLSTAANAADVIVMITTNGGTLWRAFAAGLKFSS